MAVKMGNGKSYLTVIERMNMLIEEKTRKYYSLETEVKYESGVVIVKAILTLYSNKISDAGSSMRYTGHALGEVGKHKTLEATETHAIGRALASAGWFGDEFASANEMESWEQSKSVNLKDVEVKLPEIPKDDEATIDDIAKASNGVKVVDDMRIPFGRHKGMMVSECDKKYQKWLSTSELDFATFKNPDGSLKVDEIKKLNDCATYFLAVDVEIPF